MTERRGAYITFDGGDGLGKTTQVQRLAERLDVQAIREPGQTELGKAIRSLILHSTHPMSRLTEVLLFSADRAETMQAVIKPAIVSGKSVISDRSSLSMIAYQCYGGGVPMELVRQATQLATGDLRPDKYVIFDADPAIAYERMAGLGKTVQADRFEREGRAFHAKVREGFLEQAKELGSMALVIDASGTEDEIHTLLSEQLDTLLVEGVQV